MAKNGVAREVVDEALEAGEKKSAATIAKETLTGDLRDAALDWIRFFQKPWSQLSEDMQRDAIESITKQAVAAAARAVEIIAADGRDVITARVESVTVKDGLKAVLTCIKTEENLTRLGMAEGSKVAIVCADVADYVGEKAPAEAEPEQRNLLGDQDGAAAEA